MASHLGWGTESFTPSALSLNLYVSPLPAQVEGVVKSHPSLTRISLVGNSLGGLYVRYAAKILYRGHPDNSEDSQQPIHEDETDDISADSMTPAPPGGGENASKRKGASASKTRFGGTVAGLEPSVFMTIAAPHLGVRSFTYVPLHPKLKPLASAFAGKSGSDLFMLTSRDGNGEAVRSETGESDGLARRSLLYEMSTSEEYLLPLKVFRRRRAYANRRGDFMVPYSTAAFVEPGEGDGEENASEIARRKGIPVGTGWFSIRDRIVGAKEGSVVGFTRITASTPQEIEDDKDSSGRLETNGRRNRKKADIKTIETKMAAGLNSCGWEKVRSENGWLTPETSPTRFFLRLAMFLYTTGIELVILDALIFMESP